MQEDLLRPDLVGFEGIAKIAGLSVHSIKAYRRFGLLPAPVSEGHTLVWQRADIEAWVQADGHHPKLRK